MCRTWLLKAAIRRGFLKETKEKPAECQLGELGIEVKQNLIADWLQNVRRNRVCDPHNSDLVGGRPAIQEIVRSQLSRYKPPFCITLESQIQMEGVPMFETQCNLRNTARKFSQCHFYLVCHPRRLRLNFAEILRRRQSWWTEIVNNDSQFQFKPSSSDSNDMASYILALPSNNLQQQEHTQYGIETIEEIPTLDIPSADLAAIQNTLWIEPAILAILQDGASKMGDEDALFRLHKRITPHPIALLCVLSKSENHDAVNVLCSHTKGIMEGLGIRYLYKHFDDQEDLDIQWKQLKESGVLYGVVIDADVLRNGVVKFKHCDLDMDVDTPLPNIRAELLQRVGHGIGNKSS